MKYRIMRNSKSLQYFIQEKDDKDMKWKNIVDLKLKLTIENPTESDIEYHTKFYNSFVEVTREVDLLRIYDLPETNNIIDY